MDFLKNLGFSYYITFFILFNNFSLLHSSNKFDFLVSIPPQKFFIKKIVKNKYKIGVLYNQKADLHHFDILPHQIIALDKIKTYFILDQYIFFFERKFINFFKKSKRYKNIDIFSWERARIDINDFNIESKLKHKDPHIWFSIDHIKQYIDSLYEYFATIDKKNKSFYKNNLDQFIKEINNLDQFINKKLKKIKKRTYLSYHSSLFYYEKKYKLNAITIEEKNRNPSGSRIYYLNQLIKKHKFKFILIGKQYSKLNFLNIMDRKIKLKKIYWNPLKENWIENMIFITNVFSNNL